MKLTFIGAGKVGSTLANKFQQLGHDVTIATNNPSSNTVKMALQRNQNLKAADTKDAIKQADVVFLAVPFAKNEEIVIENRSELKGKILVDCTNPIGQNLTHALNSVESGAELIQRLIPEAKVVRSFNHTTSDIMENNKFPGTNLKPLMFYCGNDKSAKETVGKLIEELGFDAIDAGLLKSSLHLDHLALMVIKMIYEGGASRESAYAILKR